MIVATVQDMLVGRYMYFEDDKPLWKDAHKDTDAYALLNTHCIYMIRDKEVVFYVGQSKNMAVRIGNHLGYVPTGATTLQRLIYANMPQSLTWFVKVFALADPPNTCTDIHTVERAMIARYRPCLNIAYNPYPTPLPLCYRLPLSEIPEDIICSSPYDCRPRNKYRVTYQTYDFTKRCTSFHQTFMYATQRQDCIDMATLLLGYKPQTLYATSAGQR